MKKSDRKNSVFEIFSMKVTKATGSTQAFLIALALILVWGISGPFFNFSETWQLVINTATTIVTFLMVFLIQKAQNKDSLAIQLKLNELVAAQANASNRLVDVEDMSEQEMAVLHNYYARLSKLSQLENSLKKSHSVEEATEGHNRKKSKHKKKPPRQEEK